MGKAIAVVFILILIIGLDQVSKVYVRNHFEYNEEITFIDGHVTLTKIENTGSFLGFGTAIPEPYKLILLTILPSLALVIGIGFLLTRQHITTTKIVGYSLLVGGGIGNVYDRLVYGSVTDFMHLRWGSLQTGVFNVADVAITTGIFVLVVHSYVGVRSKE